MPPPFRSGGFGPGLRLEAAAAYKGATPLDAVPANVPAPPLVLAVVAELPSLHALEHLAVVVDELFRLLPRPRERKTLVCLEEVVLDSLGPLTKGELGRHSIEGKLRPVLELVGGVGVPGLVVGDVEPVGLTPHRVDDAGYRDREPDIHPEAVLDRDKPAEPALSVVHDHVPAHGLVALFSAPVGPVDRGLLDEPVIELEQALLGVALLL